MDSQMNKLFFCYGTLMQKQSNHRILDNPNVEFVGKFTTEPKFTMINFGPFPAVLPYGNTSITGELYRVKTENVENRLNALEGYRVGGGKNNFYQQDLIDTPHGKARIYIQTGNPRNLPIIESGDWLKRI